jgi:hypothetical protein
MPLTGFMGFSNMSWYQYFGQHSGRRLGDEARVTPRFIIGAGVFHAVPRGARLHHALDQLLSIGAPREARQGKRCRRLPVTGVEFGEGDRAQTGIEVHVALGV